MKQNRRVTIISGATASGKTEESLRLARERDCEIISCDSIQVYKGMDVGSAKASENERQEIPHHLIDVENPDTPFDVARYIELSRKSLSEIFARGKDAIVVGGSGFYLKAWFSAVTDKIEIPQEIKKHSESIAALGTEALADALLNLDANAGKFIDLKNPRRTKNALERCMASGLNVRALLENFAKLPCPLDGDFEKKFILLEKDDSEMRERIRARTFFMFDDEKILEETERLLLAGIEKNPSACSAVGYKEVIDWLKCGRKTPIEDLRESVCLSTIRLVKKQNKFFKNSLFAGAEKKLK